MAVALPPDMTKRPIDTNTPNASPGVVPWRLPSHHVQFLRDVARGLEESDAGVRTKYLHDEGGSMPVREQDHVHLYDVEAFCDRFGALDRDWANKWRVGIRRCRAALRRLQVAGDQDSVAVLHVVYGYGDPSVREWPRHALDILGELAPLVRYVEATEERRRAMVRAMAVAEKAPPRPHAPGLMPLALVVDMAGFRQREAFLDRVTSSGDAVREALAAFPEQAPRRRPDESPSAHLERMRAHGARAAAHGERRREYLDAALEQAEAMLTLASRAYHAAWGAASGDY